MNDWERRTVQLSLLLLPALFLVFLFMRKRWARSVSLPTILFILNCAWLASATVYLAAEKFGVWKGAPFAAAYSFIIFVSPIIAAAGILEAVVVVYHVLTIKTSWPTLALRMHCLAFLSAAFCAFAYLMARHVTAR